MWTWEGIYTYYKPGKQNDNTVLKKDNIKAVKMVKNLANKLYS